MSQQTLSRNIPLSVGRDRRARTNQIQVQANWCGFIDGRFHRTYLWPGPQNPFSGIASDCALTEAAMDQFPQRPWVTASPPFTVDALGQSFPYDTVWVCVGSLPELFPIRQIGTTTNPITRLGGVLLSNGDSVQNFYYWAAGIPVGAVGTITLESYDGVSTWTTVVTLTVTGSVALGAMQFIPLFANAVAYPQQALYVSSSWTGGVPTYEALSQDQVTAYWAVPGVLPGSFTARNNSDMNRCSSSLSRALCDVTRSRGNGPYQSYATAGMFQSSVNAGGAPLQGPNYWIAGSLQEVGVLPLVVNADAFLGAMSETYLALTGYTPMPHPVTTLGYRYFQVRGVYTQITRAPLSSDSLVLTVTQDGTPIWTTTLTGAAIAAGLAATAIAVTMPAIGSGTTFSASMSFTGATGSPTPYWTFELLGDGSGRCDIPFPFSAASLEGDTIVVAPGGYLAASLAAPENFQPLAFVGYGITTYTPTSPVYPVWAPAANGWWTVVQDSAALAGTSTDEFNWQDPRTLWRCLAGQALYSVPNTLDAMTLTAFTPSFTALSGTPATIDMTPSASAFWGFGSVAGTSGTAITISVAFDDVDSALAGLRIQCSSTDATGVVFDQEFILETYWELLRALNGGSGDAAWLGVLNTPPSSPTNGYVVVVGAAPTGAFVGYTNDIAIWDAYSLTWTFWKPRAGSVCDSIPSSGTGVIFDGSHWLSYGQFGNFQYIYRPTASTTIAVVFEAFCTDYLTPGKVKVTAA
jgi:hypothetical protein